MTFNHYDVSHSFMTVDTRPTARVTFKKNFDESIKNFINNDS